MVTLGQATGLEMLWVGKYRPSDMTEAVIGSSLALVFMELAGRVSIEWLKVGPAIPVMLSFQCLLVMNVPL